MYSLGQYFLSNFSPVGLVSLGGCLVSFVAGQLRLVSGLNPGPHWPYHIHPGSSLSMAASSSELRMSYGTSELPGILACTTVAS